MYIIHYIVDFTMFVNNGSYFLDNHILNIGVPNLVKVLHFINNNNQFIHESVKCVVHIFFFLEPGHCWSKLCTED